MLETNGLYIGHLARRRLEREDNVIRGDRLAIVPGHAVPEGDIDRLAVDPLDRSRGGRYRQAIRTNAHQAVPDQLRHPGIRTA